MFRILVPVDFYKTSFSAFNYAANFSQLFPEAEIILLHIINGGFNTDDVVIYNPMMAREDAAIKKLKYFHQKYPQELGVELPKVNIREEARFGIPGFAIAEYASANGVDMVIMGTRDQHNIFDKMLGSASAITLRTAKCSVMLIHENAKYNHPKKIVFAFDHKSDIEEAIERYRKLNSVIKAKTDFVHINKGKKDDITHQKSEIVEELFEENFPPFSFEIKAIDGDNVQTALRDYCLFEKSDILTMMHREEGLFSNIFRTHQSVKMAQEFHLPVLVFHEDN